MMNMVPRGKSTVLFHKFTHEDQSDRAQAREHRSAATMVALLVCSTLLPSLTARAHRHLMPSTAVPLSRRVTLLGAGSSLSFWSGPARASVSSLQDEPESDNIFGRILRYEAPAEVVEDLGPESELFVFRDRRPASSIHLLVIPRHFIRDASQLTLDDTGLVQRMEAKARELVRKEVGSSFSERELALGFHWPPWYSVPWLHLHAIYPKSSMRRRYKYTAFSFYSPERVLRQLK